MSETKTNAVISAQAVKHIDLIKEYHSCEVHSEQEQRAYIFLKGMELESLRSEATHGNTENGEADKTVEALREQFFPEIPQRSAYRARNYFQALEEKIATVAIFKSGKLLTDGKPRDELVASINELTHPKGIVATIEAHKKSKLPPVEPVTPAEEAAQNKEAGNQFLKELRNKLGLMRTAMAEAVAAASDSERALTRDEIIEAGKFLDSLKPKKVAARRAKKGGK
jgi:hypothetical protein